MDDATQKIADTVADKLSEQKVQQLLEAARLELEKLKMEHPDKYLELQQTLYESLSSVLSAKNR